LNSCESWIVKKKINLLHPRPIHPIRPSRLSDHPLALPFGLAPAFFRRIAGSAFWFNSLPECFSEFKQPAGLDPSAQARMAPEPT
jgi:hypothetical protein